MQKKKRRPNERFYSHEKSPKSLKKVFLEKLPKIEEIFKRKKIVLYNKIMNKKENDKSYKSFQKFSAR